MTTNHIDQLTEWWESAETGRFREGDSLIFKYGDEYTVQPAYEDGEISRPDEERILSRAPKPKPAWHDAPAVIAEVHAFVLPRVFVKDYDGIWNDALTGRGYSPDALSHVTPLIEAKVTDEMAERAREEFFGGDVGGPVSGPSSARRWRAALTAALGLETE